MRIRKATKKDFKKIAKMIKTQYLKHYSENWTEDNAIKTLNYYSKAGKIFVAQEDKNAIGFVIIRQEFYNDRKSLMIEELVVDGHFQGRGIGRKIMDFVEDYSKKNKIKFMWLITSKKAAAFKFYRKIGYKYNKNTAYFSKELK